MRIVRVERVIRARFSATDEETRNRRRGCNLRAMPRRADEYTGGVETVRPSIAPGWKPPVG
jgi:hypothetical protein